VNLLIDPVFSVQTSAGPVVMASLPELLALHGSDRVESLEGLRKHQAGPLHVFLSQLAGMVLANEGHDPANDVDRPAAMWLDGIRRLTARDGRRNDDAWTLVVEDITRPAFMQAPCVSRAAFETEYKFRSAAPDGIDILQTAKNHDVKAARTASGTPEQWAYALISLQTTIGVLGAGQYGVARMNGGYGSRPIVGWQESLRPGARFIRDVRALQDLRAPNAERFGYSLNGLALVWTRAWDGSAALALDALDPLFIEIARRMRLVRGEHGLYAMGATSKASRIAAGPLKGNVGDPWIPINVSTNGALTVSKHGFTPSLLRDLLFEDGYVAAPMQKLPRGDGDGWLTAAVLVRGQGTTDGFHEVTIRVPAIARSLLLAGGASRDRLATLSKCGIDGASHVLRCLRYAVATLLEGGPGTVNMGKPEISRWVDSVTRPFHAAWGNAFFDWLWSTPNEPDDAAAERRWIVTLRDLALEALERAFVEFPARAGRGYRSRVNAQGALLGSLYKKFGDAMEGRRGN
jgi:CRISPR system Cascade subunit CasA